MLLSRLSRLPRQINLLATSGGSLVNKLSQNKNCLDSLDNAWTLTFAAKPGAKASDTIRDATILYNLHIQLPFCPGCLFKLEQLK